MFRVALSSKIVPTAIPGVPGGTRGETELPDGVAARKALAGVGLAGGIVLVLHQRDLDPRWERPE